MRYIISYDLIDASEADYDRIINEIVRLGGKRVLYSQWVVRRINTSAAGLRDHFFQYMRDGDRLLVTCLDSADWAGMNLVTDPNTV